MVRPEVGPPGKEQRPGQATQAAAMNHTDATTDDMLSLAA